MATVVLGRTGNVHGSNFHETINSIFLHWTNQTEKFNSGGEEAIKVGKCETIAKFGGKKSRLGWKNTSRKYCYDIDLLSLLVFFRLAH